MRALFLLLLFCPFTAFAAEAPQTSFSQSSFSQSSFSMHGTPKYAGRDHFDYVNADAPKGGILKSSFTGTFDNVNPYSVRGTLAAGQGWGSPTLTHESLMARGQDEPFGLYGLIAETITVPDDRSWVEFSVNPKARWNDGTSITADDVLFSYEQLRAKGRPNHRNYYSKVAKAEKVGERSVRFTFDPAKADRELPLIMGLMPVLCKKWWETRDIGAPSLEIPVTSGPYKIESVDPGRRLVYRRDQNYWGRDIPANIGQWNFDKITYDYYRDRNIALEAFKAHAYDFRREQDPRPWRISYETPALKKGDMKQAELAHGRPEPMRGFIFNTRRPLFADIRIREALTYAFDWEWVNKALYGNMYRRNLSFFPNTELASSGLPQDDELAALTPFKGELPPELFTQPFTLPTTDASGPSGQRDNLQKALALLESAGWHFKSGRLTNAKGESFTFEILIVDPMDQKLSLELSRSLKRLGIEVRIRPVESAQYQSRMTDYDFDMTVNFWTSTLSPGNEQTFYWGSKAAGEPGTRNYAGVKNPAIDSLANGIAKAPTREELVARVRALDRALLWGYYVIPLGYLGRDLIAYWNDFGMPSALPVFGAMPEQTWWSKELESSQ